MTKWTTLKTIGNEKLEHINHNELFKSQVSHKATKLRTHVVRARVCHNKLIFTILQPLLVFKIYINTVNITVVVVIVADPVVLGAEIDFVQEGSGPGRRRIASLAAQRAH